MNLQTMLEKCRRDQWEIGDLDWSKSPRPMSKEDEMAIVQCFTDMAGIERLAAALFDAQRSKVDDPVLQEIFASFVKDELRHSHAATLLADHYDVHRHQLYRMNPSLERFTPHFVNLIKHVSPDIANAYVTSGELLLDIALLRSINDFVDDDMSEQAMRLINRDESRHIAVDFHMVEYYCSRAYLEKRQSQPRRSLRARAHSSWALANVLWHARPFFRDVFFRPIDRMDPTGRRLREAFKRVQLVSSKPEVARHSFVAFMLRVQRLYNNPMLRLVTGRILLRLLGLEPRLAAYLYDDAEKRRWEQMSFDQMAQEALDLKYAT